MYWVKTGTGGSNPPLSAKLFEKGTSVPPSKAFHEGPVNDATERPDHTLMTRQPNGATAILESLIGQLGDQKGPIEQVVAEWQGAEVLPSLASIIHGAARERAMEVIEELGDTWGPTGDPTWVDGLVPGRPEESDGPETDFMFGLYRRPGIYAYARLRGHSDVASPSLRLVLGVLRKPAGHG